MSHTHCYNLCECGKIAPINLSDDASAEDDHGSGGGDGDAGGMLGKTEAKLAGKALVSVAVSEKQIDLRQQYDDDSKTVGAGLESMSASLDALSSDIKELGRCVKSSAVSANLLQRVQERVNNEIRGALNSEQSKMKVKDKRISTLNRKLKKIQRNQRSLIFGHKMYQALRWIVIAFLVVIVVLTIVINNSPDDTNDSEAINECTDGNCTKCDLKTPDMCTDCLEGFILTSNHCVQQRNNNNNTSSSSCACPR